MIIKKEVGIFLRHFWDFFIDNNKLLASKRPGKVRKYSFFMLGCFVLMYLAVMAVEIVKALSGLF